MSEIVQNRSNLSEKEMDQDSLEKLNDLTDHQSLNHTTSDIRAYFAGQVKCMQSHDPYKDDLPYPSAYKLARNFAELNCLNPETFVDDDEDDDDDDDDNELDKEAVHSALLHLASSVLTSDPSVASPWVTESRLDNIYCSIPVTPVVESLNALHEVVPSLLAAELGVEWSGNALEEHLGYIARNRPHYWNLEECKRRPCKEQEYRKTTVNWLLVGKSWLEIWRDERIWIDETVFRILCAVPLRGERELRPQGRGDTITVTVDSCRLTLSCFSPYTAMQQLGMADHIRASFR